MLVIFEIMVGVTVVFISVMFGIIVAFTVLSTALFPASIKSTQFGVFQSLPQLDQGSSDVNDANM